MGKTPKIYEKFNRPFKSDRQLVFNYQNAKTIEEWKEASYELWDKYIRVISIGKRELIKLCNNYGMKMTDVIETYEGRFWEKFLNQLYGIRLEEVTHIPSWSMYIRVLGYLRAMNRDEIKAHLKWINNTTTIDIHPGSQGYQEIFHYTNIDEQRLKEGGYEIDNSIDYELNLSKKIFWESIEELKRSITTEQKYILNSRIKNIPNYQVQSKLKINQIEYKNQLFLIKSKLEQIIKNISEKNGLKDFDYSKLCLELQ
jgi:hypothetical protein